MADQLRRSEKPVRGVLRVLGAQIDEAQSLLSGRHLSDAAIHQGRKSIKKTRATLRLMRDAIPKAAYQRNNRNLRDIARRLSATRDAAVMLETLDRLKKLYGPAAEKSTPAKFRQALEAEQLRGDSDGRKPSAAKELKAVRTRLSRIRPEDDSWKVVCTSMKRVYGSGRRAMRQAQRTPTSECLHEWRKQTKHLWHQLQVLEPLSPGKLGELADQAHKLADYLGDDHDLAVLRDKVIALEKLFIAVGGTGALLALIDRCRNQLCDKAFLVGRRIYAERPADFAARVARFWKRWQT